MITTENGFKSRTIKCSAELNNYRTLEKLEIERRYWQEFGVEWRIVTEKEIDIPKAKNIEWLYPSAKLPEYLTDRRYREELLKRIKDNSIQDNADWFDENYGYPSGSGLRLIKHLLWNRKIVCDMDKNISLDHTTLTARY